MEPRASLSIDKIISYEGGGVGNNNNSNTNGIFSLKGFAEAEVRPMLGAYCPNLLYPYARQAITNIVAQAGFPQLYLQHINFDALFQQHEQEAAAKESAEKA